MDRTNPARGVQQHRHNLALVARLVAIRGPVSRATVARDSGLTKTTVTQLAGELLDGGLIRELGTSRAGGPGRPATLLVVNSSGPAGIGLQVEADHVAGCLVDLTGRVRDRAIRRVADLRGDPARTLKAAEPVLRRLLSAADAGENVVAGVTAGVPGTVTAAGTVRSAELGWPETGFSRSLQQRVTVLSGGTIPVTVYNGHHLAALAERWLDTGADRTGAGQREQGHPEQEHAGDGSLVHGAIGHGRDGDGPGPVGQGRTGLPGGTVPDPDDPDGVRPGRARTGSKGLLYVGGELALGAAFLGPAMQWSAAMSVVPDWTGSFGHIRLRRSGPRCACGARGCLDVVAGPRAVLRAAGGGAVTSRLGAGKGLAPEPASAQDRESVRAVRRAGAAIADALSGVVALTEPGAVVVGGQLTTLSDELADRLARTCPEPVSVRRSRLSGDAVARAAALTVTRGLLDEPADWLAP